MYQESYAQIAVSNLDNATATATATAFAIYSSISWESLTMKGMDSFNQAFMAISVSMKSHLKCYLDKSSNY